MSDREVRFEIAAEALAKAIIRNHAGIPILVEGKKDVKCLHSLGFDGVIEVLNRGWDTGRIVAFLHEKYGANQAEDGDAPLIVLMDWDRTGGRIQTMLRKRLQAMDMKIDESLRKVLMRAMKPEGKTVESMHPFADNLVEKIRLIQERM